MRAIDLIIKNRKRQEISQKQCAELLKIAKSTYSEIEKGRIQLKADDFLLLCDFLNIKPSDFLKNTQNSISLNLSNDEKNVLVEASKIINDKFKN